MPTPRGISALLADLIFIKEEAAKPALRTLWCGEATCGLFSLLVLIKFAAHLAPMPCAGRLAID
jgi:hypothetical protein